MPALLHVIYGPMFAGKTEEIFRKVNIERIAQRQVIVAKPATDNRTDAFIASRRINERGEKEIVQQYPATIVRTAAELRTLLLAIKDTLVFDEGQFFPQYFARMIYEVLQSHDQSDIHIIVAGLDLTYALEPFGPMPTLIAMADEVTRLTGVCMQCHRRGAQFTQRTSGGTEAVQVGDVEAYQVRCRRCHYIYNPTHVHPVR